MQTSALVPVGQCQPGVLPAIPIPPVFGVPFEQPKDGATPQIGVNGNWWVGGKDTGVRAEGRDGKTLEITQDTIDRVVALVLARVPAGKEGPRGVGVERFSIERGGLYVSFTDGTRDKVADMDEFCNHCEDKRKQGGAGNSDDVPAPVFYDIRRRK